MEPWLNQYEYGKAILTRNLKVWRSVLSVIVSSILLTIAFHALHAKPASISSTQPASTSGFQLPTNLLAHYASLRSDLIDFNHKIDNHRSCLWRDLQLLKEAFFFQFLWSWCTRKWFLILHPWTSVFVTVLRAPSIRPKKNEQAWGRMSTDLVPSCELHGWVNTFSTTNGFPRLVTDTQWRIFI